MWPQQLNILDETRHVAAGEADADTVEQEDDLDELLEDVRERQVGQGDVACFGCGVPDELGDGRADEVAVRDQDALGLDGSRRVGRVRILNTAKCSVF